MNKVTLSYDRKTIPRVKKNADFPTYLELTMMF